MMTLMIAAVAAASQPAVPPATQTPAQHSQHMNQQGQPADHKGMDCCKDCCKDMAAKHEGHTAEHSEHSSR